MIKNVDENEVLNKLKYIGLDLKKIPKFLKENQEILYRPSKIYDETNCKIYRYIDINDIEILLTPTDRLEDITKKYKEAIPLSAFLDSKDEDKYENFIELVKNLDVDKLEELENEQKKLNEKIPFEVKYKDNFIWQIYYSEIIDKYFMLFPLNESRTESLFYLIKKKIELKKSRKKEKIYVPISHAEYSNNYLKKSEISDLENYLWLFTKEWPSIYEQIDKNGNISIQIVGSTNVYNELKSIYKISLNNKEEAENEYKLIKALFILQSYDEELYDFKTNVNKDASLEFCYNLRKITYENLPEFILEQVINKNEYLVNISNQLLVDEEKLEILKESIEKQNKEFLLKEKQIVTFLECKKSFFGRVKYFFKGKKKLTEVVNEKQVKKINKKDDEQEKNTYEFKKKDFYTIEDLLNISKVYDEKYIKYKNLEMDIKALENKKDNLEKKIKNATSYINEIESHKKSIFDFWKFTSKDEVTLLNESEEKEEIREERIKRTFDFDEDMESFGKKVDQDQRQILNKNDCDAIFAIKNDIDTFNIVSKGRVLKKDENIILKKINEFKEEYEENIEEIKKKDFDIFGNVVEDKTKIKVLKNSKHREIQKDKYKILEIKQDITINQYKENIMNYLQLIKENYGKVRSYIDFEIYKLSTEELNKNGFLILNMDLKEEMQKVDDFEGIIKLIRINARENMPMFFYSNIMFYDNLNETLPLGMDLSKEVLIDLNKIETKLICRKDFNMCIVKDNFDFEVKKIEVYEYNIEKY